MHLSFLSLGVAARAMARYVGRLRIEATSESPNMLTKTVYWSATALLIGSLSATVPAAGADLDMPPPHAAAPHYVAPPPPPPYAYYYPPRVYAFYPAYYGPYFYGRPWGWRPWGYRGWGHPGWGHRGWGHYGWRR